MTKKNFPAHQSPIQAELRGLARAARGVSRRRLQRLAAGAAATTLLIGLNAAPALAATTVVDCSPDVQCGNSLDTLLAEAQDAQTQVADKWMPLATFYKDAALKFEHDFLKLEGTGQDKLSFLKFFQDAHKLQDGALFLKLDSLKLDREAIKLQTETFKITDGTSHIKGEALALKIAQLNGDGIKLTNLEGVMGKNADALQTEYLKLVDEFQSLSGSPTTIG